MTPPQPPSASGVAWNREGRNQDDDNGPNCQASNPGPPTALTTQPSGFDLYPARPSLGGLPYEILSNILLRSGDADTFALDVILSYGYPSAPRPPNSTGGTQDPILDVSPAARIPIDDHIVLRTRFRTPHRFAVNRYIEACHSDIRSRAITHHERWQSYGLQNGRPAFRLYPPIEWRELEHGAVVIRNDPVAALDVIQQWFGEQRQYIRTLVFIKGPFPLGPPCPAVDTFADCVWHAGSSDTTRFRYWAPLNRLRRVVIVRNGPALINLGAVLEPALNRGPSEADRVQVIIVARGPLVQIIGAPSSTGSYQHVPLEQASSLTNIPLRVGRLEGNDRYRFLQFEDDFTEIMERFPYAYLVSSNHKYNYI